ncbi:BNR repeat-containing protein [soil metagenome]
MTASLGRNATLALVGFLTCAANAGSQATPSIAGMGWARSSVNTVIFRTSSVVTHGNLQYTAWYDDSARVVLAQRRIDASKWTVRVTPYTNDVTDAHNAIVLAVDGAGVLHVAWAEHARALHYARGIKPGSLELGPSVAMTGEHEAQVTYPQFYALAHGDLLFVYRDGRSGKGDVMLNRWDVRRHTWHALAHPLISGEGARNAYVNTIAIDAHGAWHLSWCWRESPDVATNHDVLYAFSPDEGKSWRTSTGRPYALPITAATAELAWAVPQGHELINQTTMTVDAAGHPMIATYWRPDSLDVPQLQLVWNDGRAWHANQVGTRTLSFRLSGGGTKRIPLSRPLVLADRNDVVHLIYRDEELGGGIWVATSRDAAHSTWRISAVSRENVGQWEPTYDPVAWQTRHRLFLFVQHVGQGDGESLENVPAQPVSIVEWRAR